MLVVVVQGAVRFVQQQHRSILHQGTGQDHQLFLSLAEGEEILLLPAVHAHLPEQVTGSLALGRRGLGQQGQTAVEPHEHYIQHRDGKENAGALGDHADSLRQCLGAPGGFACQTADAAGGNTGADTPDQGGFAAAVGADEPYGFPGLDGEVHIPDCPVPSGIAGGKLPQFDHCHTESLLAMSQIRNGAPIKEVRMLMGISLELSVRAAQSASRSSAAPITPLSARAWLPPRRSSRRAI